MGSNAKRMRGIAVHRPILVGSTATPLTPAEKATAPPDHTHKWTIAVRSAASHPLPSIPPLVVNGTALNADGTPADDATGGASGSARASAQPGTAGGAEEGSAGISTRGRDVETDYHKMIGGRDDISHFIKRVQIKLHESFAQPTRNIDRPPYQVCETGWGEFDVQIKIFFIPESGEKPVTIFHRLKLHPWHPISIRAEPRTEGAEEEEEEDDDDDDDDEEEEEGKGDGADEGEKAEGGEGQGQDGDKDDATVEGVEGNVEADKGVKQEGAEEGGSLRGTSEGAQKEQGDGSTEEGTTGAAETSHSEIQTRTQTQLLHAANAPPPVVPPVVHSWGYDEIVFPEPTEAFYEVLTAHPPTPLPASSLDAFQDPRALEAYRKALRTLARDDGLPYNETGDEPSEEVAAAAGASSSNGKPGAGSCRVVLPELQREAFTRGVMPPHPLHNPTGAMLEALSAEAMEGEAYRIDRARVQAVRELEAQRERLIMGERKLRDGKRKLEALLAGN